MVYNNVLELIGRTPVVKLNNINSNKSNLFVKLESYNPGGSSKDRPAKNIIEEAEKKGDLQKGGTIVESSSGNLAIGLALIGKQKGYKVKCIVDPKINPANLQLIKALGAEALMVQKADDKGNYLKERIRLAKELSNSPDVFWPNQYNNFNNPDAYSKTLALEIYEEFGDKLDWLVAPVGTAGLITGCARKLKELNPNIRILAVDAVGSVTFGQVAQKRLQVGLGAAIVPGNLEKELYDDVVHVSDYDSFRTTRDIALQEGLLVGGSGGSAVYAALNYIKDNEKALIIVPDRGDRYVDTIFSDEWMNENELDISFQESVLV